MRLLAGVAVLALAASTAASSVAPAARDLAWPGSRFIAIGGIEVHYLEAGSGAPALVLLHGFGASTFTWREVLGPLSRHGRTIAFDRPGFGLTGRPRAGEWPRGLSPYTPEAQADLTAALLSALGVDRAVLVGNSAGGATALLTALRQPARVAGLVLISPAVQLSGFPGRLGPLLPRSADSPLVRFALDTFAGGGEELLALAWHDPSRVTPAVREGYFRPFQVTGWEEAILQVALAARDTRLASRLGSIRVPTLVVTGDNDRIVPVEASRRVAEAIRGAEFVLLPDCGHLAHEECPEATLEALSAFLVGLPGAR